MTLTRKSLKTKTFLPVVRTLSKTMERPLGIVFLQYMNEIQRALLPNEITSIDTVKALFVRSFPAILSKSYLEKPMNNIFVLNASREYFYLLQNLKDVTDRSVLRIFEVDYEHEFSSNSMITCTEPSAYDFITNNECSPIQKCNGEANGFSTMVQCSYSTATGRTNPMNGSCVDTNSQTLACNESDSLNRNGNYCLAKPDLMLSLEPKNDNLTLKSKKCVTFDKSVSFSDDSSNISSPIRQHSLNHTALKVPIKSAIKSCTLPRMNLSDRNKSVQKQCIQEKTNNSPVNSQSTSINELMKTFGTLYTRIRELKQEKDDIKQFALDSKAVMRETLQVFYSRSRFYAELGSLKIANSIDLFESSPFKSYTQDFSILESHIWQLETRIEVIRCNVIGKRLKVSLEDINSITATLCTFSNCVMCLQNRIKQIGKLKSNSPRILNDNGFCAISEQTKLDKKLSRLKKISGTLGTLKRLASVQERRSDEVCGHQTLRNRCQEHSGRDDTRHAPELCDGRTTVSCASHRRLDCTPPGGTDVCSSAPSVVTDTERASCGDRTCSLCSLDSGTCPERALCRRPVCVEDMGLHDQQAMELRRKQWMLENQYARIQGLNRPDASVYGGD